MPHTTKVAASAAVGGPSTEQNAVAGPTAISPPRLTRVNGIGMWNSWTRNFGTALLALLDLLDNAVDAALVEEPPSSPVAAAGMDGSGLSSTLSCDIEEKNFRGAIHVCPDCYAFGEGPKTTGLVVINNSKRPIKPLDEILVVYSSRKGQGGQGKEGEFADTIGENGVGLKQGCATLSDLSFVCVRNGNKLGLGIIAYSLQREEGICLPSFEFRWDGSRFALRAEMERVLASSEAAACVEHYGEGRFAVGIDRIFQHFDEICRPGGWGVEEHVFCLVVHEPKHARSTDDAQTEELNKLLPVTSSGGSEDRSRHAAEVGMATQSLMTDLSNELPRHYLHIPLDFDFRVDGTPVQFCYWQRRLVELSVFCILVDPNVPYIQRLEVDQREGHPIRIFCGFDADRIASKDAHSCASLNIYSRRSGRLIKHVEDARAMLGLTNSGTDYSQGLTILVDDINGHLPLSPTKQDVAFGEQANGAVYKKNLYAWVGAIANLFWKHHFETCGNKKRNLTNMVRAHFGKVPDVGMETLDDGDFTRFEDVSWFKTPLHRISVVDRKKYRAVRGQDTLMSIQKDEPEPAPAPAPEPEPAPELAPTSASSSTSRERISQRKKTAESEDASEIYSDESIGRQKRTVASPKPNLPSSDDGTRKRKRPNGSDVVVIDLSADDNGVGMSNSNAGNVKTEGAGGDPPDSALVFTENLDDLLGTFNDDQEDTDQVNQPQQTDKLDAEPGSADLDAKELRESNDRLRKMIESNTSLLNDKDTELNELRQLNKRLLTEKGDNASLLKSKDLELCKLQEWNKGLLAEKNDSAALLNSKDQELNKLRELNKELLAENNALAGSLESFQKQKDETSERQSNDAKCAIEVLIRKDAEIRSSREENNRLYMEKLALEETVQLNKFEREELLEDLRHQKAKVAMLQQRVKCFEGSSDPHAT